MTVSTLGAGSRLTRIFRDRFSGATSGTTRVWILAAALGTLAAGFGLVMLPGAPPDESPVAIPWPLLLLAFYVAEAKVIHLHVGQSAHSFSLTEFPLVAGLLMVTPTELVDRGWLTREGTSGSGRHQTGLWSYSHATKG